MTKSSLSSCQKKFPFGIKLFVNLTVSYMIMLVVVYFIESEVIKQIANVYAIVIFGIILIYVVASGVKKIPVSLSLSLLVFYVGMLASFFVNGFSQDLPVFAKLLMGPAFIVLGYSVAGPVTLMSDVPRTLLFSIAILFGLPVALIAISVIVGAYVFDSTAVVGIFANRNNAALYMISVLALLNNFHIKMIYSVLATLFVGLIFGTLGVFIAIIFALIFVFSARKNIKYGLFVTFVPFVAIFVYMFFPDMPMLGRLETAYASLRIIYGEGSGGVAMLSYADLYSSTGSTDLSLFFRLKHWDNILSLWAQGSIENQIFGSGVGASMKNTMTKLVPHNDYLRYFYECGIFPFLGFFLLQIAVLKRIGRNHLLVPFLVISIYFVSENLANNYLAMMIYYFSTGLLLRQVNYEKRNKNREYFLNQFSLNSRYKAIVQ